MNISGFHFIVINLKIFDEIVTHSRRRDCFLVVFCMFFSSLAPVGVDQS